MSLSTYFCKKFNVKSTLGVYNKFQNPFIKYKCEIHSAHIINKPKTEKPQKKKTLDKKRLKIPPLFFFSFSFSSGKWEIKENGDSFIEKSGVWSFEEVSSIDVFTSRNP